MNTKQQTETLEKCAVIIVVRDRFSTTNACLDAVIENTPEEHDLILVMGGVPPKVQSKLESRYHSKVRLIFTHHFLNPAQARNIGLRAAETRLAVLMDNDVYVKPGWLTPLIECQHETNGAMVVPVILEYDKEIHTAGNDLYMTYRNGEAFAHKELRFHGMAFDDETNLKRTRTDYGELHLQLVEVEAALKLGVYDEKIQEVGECDAGLTWAKAGRELWFEPRSVVNYEPPGRIEAEDIPIFVWRWDMRLILKGYQHFYQKWGIDITEHGNFRNFLLGFNHKVGILPRLYPSKWTVLLDRYLRGAGQNLVKVVLMPVSFWRRIKAYYLGYYEWPRSLRDENWQLNMNSMPRETKIEKREGVVHANPRNT